MSSHNDALNEQLEILCEKIDEYRFQDSLRIQKIQASVTEVGDAVRKLTKELNISLGEANRSSSKGIKDLMRDINKLKTPTH